MLTDGQGAEDRRDPLVPDEDKGGAQAPATPVVVDPWAEAFAEVEDKATAAAAVAAPDAAGDEAGAVATPEAAAGAGDAPVGAGDGGGPVPPAADAGDSDGAGAVGDVTATIERYSSEIEKRAIDETARIFMERTNAQGQKVIRQTNGQLGATISDSDIYRVDPETGAAAFYNPDTGRPFDGPNPRAQAKEWVEAYNEELQDTFNQLAERRIGELQEEMAPVVELLKFTPTFEALDPTRQRMLEALIEGHEVYDAAGDHVGYDCDLNQKLAQVNRQVAAIQASRQAAAPAAPETKEPTGPALDMPTTPGGSGTGKDIKSIADGLEALQDAQIAKARQK